MNDNKKIYQKNKKNQKKCKEKYFCEKNKEKKLDKNETKNAERLIKENFNVKNNKKDETIYINVSSPIIFTFFL